MKSLSALLIGFLSGFLIYMMSAMIFSSKPSMGFVLATFIGGWGVTSFFLLKGAKTASKVWARGSLIGVMEWVAMIFTSWIFAGKAVTQVVTETGAESTAEQAGAAIGAGLGGGLIGTLGTGLSFVMIVVCLITWFVASRFNKEMKQEDNREKVSCKNCAEMIFMEAKQCRHCGHNRAQELKNTEDQTPNLAA